MGGGRIGTVLAVLATVGCHSTEPKLALPKPHVEEFVVPPDEERFNQPPEQGYRKPPPKKEFRPGPNGSMPGMGGGPGGPTPGGGLSPQR